MLVHETEQVWVIADVDKGIAPVVRALQTIPGIRTLGSCQGTLGEGGAEPYSAFVLVSYEDDAALAALEQGFNVERVAEPLYHVHVTGIKGDPNDDGATRCRYQRERSALEWAWTRAEEQGDDVNSDTLRLMFERYDKS